MQGSENWPMPVVFVFELEVPAMKRTLGANVMVDGWQVVAQIGNRFV